VGEKNEDRLAKNLADILDIKIQIANVISPGKEPFLTDKKNPLAVKYLLIEAVEAITDVCQHLLAKTKGVACSGYIDCIVKAGEHGIIAPPLTNKLRRLADLRNSLIHRYWIINDEQLFEQCSANIDDFQVFSEQINAFIARY